VRAVEVETGVVLKEALLDRKWFGEGLAKLDNRLYQLTWLSPSVLVYDTELQLVGAPLSLAATYAHDACTCSSSHGGAVRGQRADRQGSWTWAWGCCWNRPPVERTTGGLRCPRHSSLSGTGQHHQHCSSTPRCTCTSDLH
jgi:hypothetical protein